MANTDRYEPSPQEFGAVHLQIKQAAEFPYSETFYFFFLLTGTEFVVKGEEEPLPVCKGSIAAS